VVDSLIENLFLLLDDPDPNIVRHSIDALMKHPGPQLEARLRGLLTSSTEDVAIAAVDGLAQLYVGREGLLLGELLDDPSPVIRRRAIFSLSDGIEPSHVPRLMRNLKEETASKGQSTILGFLARFPEEVDFSHVIHLLSSPDDRVRSNVLDLISSKDLTSFEDDVMRLIDDPAPRVRASAMGALWSRHREDFVARIEAELESDNADQLSASIHLLGFLPDFPDVSQALTRFLDSEDTTVRRQAAISLASLGGRINCLPIMDRLLDEADLEVRELLLRLARNGGSDQVVDRVGEVLDNPDEDPRRRATAAQVLAALSNPRGIPVILNALSCRDNRIRANAVEALGCMGDPQLIDTLLSLVADPTPRVAANACIAVWELGGVDGIDRLSDLLASRESGDQLSAIYALGEIGMVQFMKPLNDLLDRLSGAVVLTDGQKRIQKNIHRAMDKIRARSTDSASSS